LNDFSVPPGKNPVFPGVKSVLISRRRLCLLA
jgi:hypothetical protein